MEFVKGTTIKCDKCDWSKSIEFEQVPEWHNKECPKCNDAVIIDDSDLRNWHAVASIAHLQSALGYKEDDNNEKGYIKIDTAK